MRFMKFRPVIARRFDVTTAVYRSKGDALPAFELSARGSYRLDPVAIASAVLIAGSAMLLGSAIRAMGGRDKSAEK